MDQPSLSSDIPAQKSSTFKWILTIWILLLCVVLLMVNISWAGDRHRWRHGSPAPESCCDCDRDAAPLSAVSL